MTHTSQSSNGDFSPNVVGTNNNVKYHLPPKKLGTEVQTILKVIECIKSSRESNNFDGDEVDFVRDLERKFNRFEEYREQLKDIYKEHAVHYGYDYELAKNSTEMNEFEFEECYIELRRLSLKALEDNLNPIDSLETMVEKFYIEFASSDSDIDFSKPAIRYFLIKELIACNVFPNLED